MQLPVRIGKLRGGRGLLAAGRQAVVGAMREWMAGQVKHLKGAFVVGGQQNHGGDKWPLNEDGTISLTETGALRRSIKGVLVGNTVELVASASYASYHQLGSGPLPVRKVIVITKKDEREFAADLVKHWNREVNGTGGR